MRHAWIKVHKEPQKAAHREAEERGWPYVIAEQVTVADGRQVFRYGVVDSLEVIPRLVLGRPRGRRFLYEQIYHAQAGGSDAPCRVYFDIDGKFKDLRSRTGGAEPPTKFAFLKESLDTIIEFLDQNYDDVGRMGYDEFLVQDGSVDGYKHSFHLLLPYRFDNIEERQQFALQVADAKLHIQNATTGDVAELPAADEKVYTTNRNMRMLYNAKRGTPNSGVFLPLNELDPPSGSKEDSLVFMQWPADEAEQILASLIMNIKDPDGDEYMSLGTPKNPKQGPSKKRRVLSATPRDVIIDLPSHRALESWISELLKSTHTRPFRFDWQVDERCVNIKCGTRTCPFGNTHDADRFQIKIKDRGTADEMPGGKDFFYTCCFTSQSSCRGRETLIASTRASWIVAREVYEHYVGDDPNARPAVTPYFDRDHRTVVEGSGCGVGKTFGAKEEVLLCHCSDLLYDVWVQEASTHFKMPSAVLKSEKKRTDDGPRVLWLTFRRALVRDTLQNKGLERLGFHDYQDLRTAEDQTTAFSCNKLAICINSLYKLPEEVIERGYDLLVIDECEEVFVTLTTIHAQSDRGTRWTLFSVLSRIFRNSKKRLLMSAHADFYTKVFLDHCGEASAIWRENKISTLKDNTYDFHHTFDEEDAITLIETYLGRGYHLAIPCTEKADLKNLLVRLEKTFPSKTFLAVHGDLSDQAKRAAVDSLIHQQYDAVLFTSVVDCGVSVEEIECDYVIARINHRSITARQIMQIIHRFRKVKQRHFILSFSSKTMDYQRFPGYEERDAPTDDEPIPAEIKVTPSKKRDAQQRKKENLRKGLQFLYNHHETHIHDLYKVTAGGKVVTYLERTAQPAQQDEQAVYDHILHPGVIDKGVVELNTTVIDTIFEDYHRIRSQIVSGLDTQAYAPLVEMMVAHTCERLNLQRDLVNNLARYVALQGSKSIHTYKPSRSEEKVFTFLDEALEVKRREVWDMSNAPDADIDRMRDLEARKQEPGGLTTDETLEYDKGHIVQTYGKFDVSILGELEARIEELEKKPLEDGETKKQREAALRETQKAYRDAVNNIRESIQRGTQQAFRDLSFLNKPLTVAEDHGGGGAAATLKKRFSDLMQASAKASMRLDIGGGGANGDDDILPITSFEKNINKQAQNIALLEVALAFGFDDPFNQADSKSSKGSLDQGKLDLAHKNYLKVTGGPKVAENYCCKKHDGDHNGVMCCENVVMSAGAFLSENWHLRPTKIDLSRSDKKKGMKKSELTTFQLQEGFCPWSYFAKPTFEAYERYRDFYFELRNPEVDKQQASIQSRHVMIDMSFVSGTPW